MTEPLFDMPAYRRLRGRIVRAYEGFLSRVYCRIRFVIINLGILNLLGVSLRGRKRVLEVGCGFGLFGCYFASRDPGMTYHGIDLDTARIRRAQRAAATLGLANARFESGDAREALALEEQYDAVIMMDLLHHIPDDAKLRLLESVLARLAPDGVLIIKDVTRRPWFKLLFTWLLDVGMTMSFGMWYWSERRFREAIPESWRMEVYPITDWLPYPHILYLVSRR